MQTLLSSLYLEKQHVINTDFIIFIVLKARESDKFYGIFLFLVD